jgi:hypothetical protein
MKIIFLDIDGVLNHELWYRRRFNEVDTNIIENRYPYYEFDPLSILLLNKLTDITGAKIVISSSWRNSYSNERFRKLFTEIGITGEVYDSTPSFYAKGLDSSDKSTAYSIPRGCEIDWWLKNIGKYQRINWSIERQDEVLEKSLVQNYVIIDDDSDMLYNQREHFVKINSYNGLLNSDIDKSIEILNTPVSKLYNL